MRFNLLIVFLLLTLSSDCQIINDTDVVTNISEIYYEIEEEEFCLVELSINNQSAEDLVLWITQDINSSLKKYLLKSRGDFNLLDLISEKILKPDNQIVFRSFIKILSREETFKFAIFIDNPNEQKVAFSKKFIKDYFKYDSVEILSKLINREHYNESSYGGNEIVLPYSSVGNISPLARVCNACLSY